MINSMGQLGPTTGARMLGQTFPCVCVTVFPVRFTFEPVDSVNQTALPNVGGLVQSAGGLTGREDGRRENLLSLPVSQLGHGSSVFGWECMSLALLSLQFAPSRFGDFSASTLCEPMSYNKSLSVIYNLSTSLSFSPVGSSGEPRVIPGVTVNLGKISLIPFIPIILLLLFILRKRSDINTVFAQQRSN